MSVKKALNVRVHSRQAQVESKAKLSLMFVFLFFGLFRFRLNFRSVWTDLQTVNHAKKTSKTLSEYLRHLTSFHERNYFPLFNVADMTFRVAKTVQVST